MIYLKDTIHIDTTPERAFDWLAHFPENYVAWHPAHVECRYVKGHALEVGTQIYCEEYLHGRLHKMVFQVTQVTGHARVEYRVEHLGKGAFEVQEADGGVEFIAELWVGSALPLVGAVVDLLLRSLFRNQIEAIRHHMAEEGHNLKRLLEGGCDEENQGGNSEHNRTGSDLL